MANALGTVVLNIQKWAAAGHCGRTDRELLENFSRGRDEVAFTALVARHGPMVLRVCRRVLHHEQDAEDAFQAAFLVLARSTASIRKPEVLADWLHGVAYRTAMKAKRSAARRRNHETRQSTMAPKSASGPKWDDVQAVLDEEILRLAEPYRSVFVRCVLEGQTRPEAAAALNVKEGTVSSRLMRARQRLQKQLARRGIQLPALLAALSFAESGVKASVPPLLVQAAVRYGLMVAAGKAAAGQIPSHIAALAAGVTRAMLLTKAKTTIALLIAVTLLGGGAGVVTQQTFAAKDQKTPAAITQKSAIAIPKDKVENQPSTSKGEPDDAGKSEPQKTRTVSGRVLDAAGKPAAGAKLFLMGASEQPTDLGASAADGSFKVTIAAPKKRKLYYLVSQIAGAGLDFTGVWESGPTDPIELRVVKDNPIRGRIVNTEGKPVAGAKVSVIQLGVYKNNSLDSFLIGMRIRHFMSGMPTGDGVRRIEAGAVLSSTTDINGQFVIHGAGIERTVTLRLSGAGIAETEVWVVNRPGFDPGPYNQASRDKIPKDLQDLAWPMWLLHGPDFSLVAEAEKRIRGVVKDIDTGKPRGGVVVRLTRNGEALLGLPLTTTADSEGRYEIRGARKAADYMVEVSCDPAAGYMACQVHVADTPGYEPITADIAVKKGVVVTGRVLDAVTKKPLPGYAKVDPLLDNPFYAKYPRFDVPASFDLEETGPDHKFRLVTIPGPVLLHAGVDSRRHAAGEMARFMFKPPISDPKYPQYFRYEGDGFVFFRPGGGRSHLQGNHCIVLQIKPDDQVVTHDILLERATALPIKIQEIGGGPLAGTWVTGMSSETWHGPVQVKTDLCSVYNLEPGKPRLMVFYEPKKKLIGTLALKGDEKERTVAVLGRPGSLKGLLIGEDGKPLVGIVVNLLIPERIAAEIHDHIHRAKLVETDINGKFQMDEIIPGQTFSLWFMRGAQAFEPLTKLENRSVQAGATLDLGEVKLKRKVEQEN